MEQSASQVQWDTHLDLQDSGAWFDLWPACWVTCLSGSYSQRELNTGSFAVGQGLQELWVRYTAKVSLLFFTSDQWAGEGESLFARSNRLRDLGLAMFKWGGKGPNSARKHFWGSKSPCQGTGSRQQLHRSPKHNLLLKGTGPSQHATSLPPTPNLVLTFEQVCALVSLSTVALTPELTWFPSPLSSVGLWASWGQGRGPALWNTQMGKAALSGRPIHPPAGAPPTLAFPFPPPSPTPPPPGKKGAPLSLPQHKLRLYRAPELPQGPGIAAWRRPLPPSHLLLHCSRHFDFGLLPSPLLAARPGPASRPRAPRLRSVALSRSRRWAPPSPLLALLRRSSPPLPLLLLSCSFSSSSAPAGPRRRRPASRSAPRSLLDPQPWPTSRRASSPRTCRSDSTARRKRSGRAAGQVAGARRRGPSGLGPRWRPGRGRGRGDALRGASAAAVRRPRAGRRERRGARSVRVSPHARPPHGPRLSRAAAGASGGRCGGFPAACPGAQRISLPAAASPPAGPRVGEIAAAVLPAGFPGDPSAAETAGVAQKLLSEAVWIERDHHGKPVALVRCCLVNPGVPNRHLDTHFFPFSVVLLWVSLSGWPFWRQCPLEGQK